MKFKFILLSLLFTLSCTPRPVAPVVPTEEGVVVGKVGNIVVTDKQVLERIASIEKSFPRVYSTHTQKKTLLTEMMNVELLYRKALELGLDKKFEFKSRLADLYVREMSEQARSQITEDEIKSFFESNKSAVEQISARHILLKTSPKMPAKETTALHAKLEGLRTELLKQPEEFANYARKYSEDSSRDSGGDLGFFVRPQMVAPFSEAAFKLKNVGDISPVIQTQFGFHLIQLAGDRRGYQPYRDLIREQLLRKTQKERLEQELAALKKGKEFQIYEDNLIKLSPLAGEILADPKELLEGKTSHEPKIKTKK